MNLSEVISFAKIGELKQLKMKDNKDDIIKAINLGVLELHKQFALWVETSTITMVDGVTSYLLDGTDPNVTIPVTTPSHQFLKIDKAYDKDGKRISINFEENKKGVITPKYDKVTLDPSIVVAGEIITLEYRAAPVFMTNEKSILPLPVQFLDPLLSYIGYRGQLSVTGKQQSETSPQYKRFLESATNIYKFGMLNQDPLYSNNIETRGFV